MAERRTLEAETAPMVEPAEVVVAMRVEPDDAVTSGGPPEAVPVVAVPVVAVVLLAVVLVVSVVVVAETDVAVCVVAVVVWPLSKR